MPSAAEEEEIEPDPAGCAARSERQIAAELNIAAATVHPHIVPIDDKAGVSTPADAAVFAMEHGLIHPPPAT